MRTVIAKFLLFTAILLLNTSVLAQENRKLIQKEYAESMAMLYEDPVKALEMANQVFAVAKEDEDYWAMGIILAGIGFMSYELEDYKAAYSNYLLAYETISKADTVDLSNKIIILNELSLIQSDFNNHDESIKYGKLAWKLAKDYVKKHPNHAEETQQDIWLIDIPYYMAIEYQDKGAHQSAGKILVELWEQAEDKNDVQSYAQVLNELGIIKLNNGEFSAAQDYFGLVVSASDVDDEYKARAYHNLASAYMEQGELERASTYFMIAKDLKNEIGDKYELFVTLQDIGELEYKKGNSKKAIEYWDTALETYQDIDTDPELYSVYNWLQLAYMDIDVAKAKEYNLKHTQLNDFYVKNQSVQRELEAQNREELSAWIDQERQQRVDAEQRQMFLKEFWPVFLGVALLLIFSGVIGVRYLRTVRANKALAQKQMSVTSVHTRDEAA